MAKDKQSATGGMTISGNAMTSVGNISVSQQALPPQPKGWPHMNPTIALHDAADVKLDTDGGDAEGS